MEERLVPSVPISSGTVAPVVTSVGRSERSNLVSETYQRGAYRSESAFAAGPGLATRAAKPVMWPCVSYRTMDLAPRSELDAIRPQRREVSSGRVVPAPSL